MLGPVFRQEMLAAGRRSRQFWVRVALGLVLLFIMGVCYAVAIESQPGGSSSGTLSIQGAAQIGVAYFAAFSWSMLIGVLLLTPAVASGAIASERERRTIEYLFTTDLSNAEIVFDKFAARMLSVAMLVLATLPVLAIFRLLGGVPGVLLLMLFGLLASTACMAASIALLASARSGTARLAQQRAFRWLMLLLISPGLLGWLMITPWGQAVIATPIGGWLHDMVVSPFLSALMALNPLVALGKVGATDLTGIGLGGSGWEMFTPIGAQLALAAGVLVITIATVRRTYLKGASTGKETKDAEPVIGRRPAVSDRPVLWKEMVFSTQPGISRRWRRLTRFAWMLLITLGAIWLALGYWMTITNSDNASFAISQFISGVITIGTGIASIGVLMAGGRAATLVASEKQHDTWVSLLTTPLAGKQVIGHKALGNLWSMRWMFAVVAVLGALAATLEARLWVALAWQLLMISLAGVFATGLGLLASQHFKKATTASVVTAITLVFCAGAYLPFLILPLAFSGSGGDEGLVLLSGSYVYLIAAPMVLALGVDEPWLYAAHVIGTIGYAVAAFAVLMRSISLFDEQRSEGSPALTAGDPAYSSAGSPPAASSVPSAG
ncbi:ABC-2 family transporter protein [Pseudobythopirellula maris]|uniref:ABC-2 family transporter protein n=1 Tax=Pseudobythopirellula maris TaxID=2527991 RepID=A0A5C5ZK40_9BACT|nr:ABC transporter permease subunit [Pseudobythopirellula maris]TWT87732.1 ABC-2 family transporter protein [Pseudobythopirellula maris]